MKKFLAAFLITAALLSIAVIFWFSREHPEQVEQLKWENIKFSMPFFKSQAAPEKLPASDDGENTSPMQTPATDNQSPGEENDYKQRVFFITEATLCSLLNGQPNAFLRNCGIRISADGQVELDGSVDIPKLLENGAEIDKGSRDILNLLASMDFLSDVPVRLKANINSGGGIPTFQVTSLKLSGLSLPQSFVKSVIEDPVNEWVGSVMKGQAGRLYSEITLQDGGLEVPEEVAAEVFAYFGS